MRTFVIVDPDGDADADAADTVLLRAGLVSRNAAGLAYGDRGSDVGAQDRGKRKLPQAVKIVAISVSLASCFAGAKPTVFDVVRMQQIG